MMISTALVLLALIAGIFAFRTGRLSALGGAIAGKYKLASS